MKIQVTPHEMEIVEVLNETLNCAVMETDLIKYLHHGDYYSRQLIMSLKCKGIIRTEQYMIKLKIKILKDYLIL